MITFVIINNFKKGESYEKITDFISSKFTFCLLQSDSCPIEYI